MNDLYNFLFAMNINTIEVHASIRRLPCRHLVSILATLSIRQHERYVL